MSLYAQYLTERTEDLILETEKGFATYRFTNEFTVYIVDIYVIPEFRKQGVARDLSDTIVGIARMKGCTQLIGSVIPSAKGSSESMKALLAYGLKLDSSAGDFILLRKDI